MQKIYAVGETILDIIFRDFQPRAAKPGGSAFNASITLGRLGAPITFISEMGQDRVGDIIASFLEENGVGTEYVDRYTHGKSAIALAFLNAQSDAEYEFYKDYPSQRLAVDFPDFRHGDLLLFGSFYALNPGIRPRVKVLLDRAREAGTSILYDPNFRSSHLAERAQLLPVIKENMAYASLVRASDEDLKNIFGAGNPDEAWESVKPHCSVMVYTANAGGVYLRSPKLNLKVEVEAINPVSTIGAGDTFNAGLVYGLWKLGIRPGEIGDLSEGQWRPLLERAIKFSREVCLSYDNYLPMKHARSLR